MNNTYEELLDFDPNNLIERLQKNNVEDYEEKLLDCIFIILNFTNQNKVPYHLERTLYNMCIDCNKLYEKALEADSKIKSIARGDLKTEFRDETELKKYIEPQLLQGYANSLVEFRKLRS